MNDSEMLRLLAFWFDEQDRRGRWGDNVKPEFQDDLRRIADELETATNRIKELEVKLEEAETYWLTSSPNNTTGTSDP